MSKNIPIQEIEPYVLRAQEAFLSFKKLTIKERAALMHSVADEIETLGNELITAAQSETSLPEARLVGEKARTVRSEEHTSELQSLMRISYAVFCLKKKTYK